MPTLLVEVRRPPPQRTKDACAEPDDTAGRHYLDTDHHRPPWRRCRPPAVRPRVCVLVGLTASVAVGSLAGCGASEDTVGGDGDAPFAIAATATLEPVQRLGSSYSMRLTIVNKDHRSLPTVGVTVTGFSRAIAAGDDGAGRVADPRRPIWVVDAPPRGASTAYRDTWSSGPLRAGERKTFVWSISPVRPGRHAIRWRIGAGLDHDRPVAADRRGTNGVLDVKVRP